MQKSLFQGQSKSTIIKQASLESAIKALMFPYREIQQRFDCPIVIAETNSGTGHNEHVDIVGSPVLFKVAAQERGIQAVRFLCDLNSKSLETLRARMGEDENTHYYPMDNRKFTSILPLEVIEKAEISNLSYARGIVYVDPNDITKGFPLEALVEMSHVMPGIDIAINYPATTSKRCKGAFNDSDKYHLVSAIIKKFGKKRGIIREPHGCNQWTLFLLTNYADFKLSRQMKQHGFRDIESDSGKQIIARCDLNKKEHAEYCNKTGRLFI